MSIETYSIETSMGRLSYPRTLPFLNEQELAEFNLIGYTGKDSRGVKTDFQRFLNGLDKGDFKVLLTKWDSGDFQEGYMIIRVVPDLPLLPKHLTPQTLFPSLGLYRIHWKSGGSSLAAVGNLPDGERWIAPCNWLAPVKDREDVWKVINEIQAVELLEEA